MFKYKTLQPENLRILKSKGTEPPFSGKYVEAVTAGSYLCPGCGAVLFRADNQFTSSCGWPSFDDELPGAVKQVPDSDGRRTEIVCVHCQGHLEHVFIGEGYTHKNLRHCVNSLAIEFVANTKVLVTEEAIIAGGCFWGVEKFLSDLPGVLLCEVGYTGGGGDKPCYQTICEGKSGHIEAVRVFFSPQRSPMKLLSNTLWKFMTRHK